MTHLNVQKTNLAKNNILIKKYPQIKYGQLVI